MQASATVWSGATFPPHRQEGLLQRTSHTYNVGKKKWRTFVKCPFHKAAIVERSQDQNDNVDSGYCLPTGSPAAAEHSADLPRWFFTRAQVRQVQLALSFDSL